MSKKKEKHYQEVRDFISELTTKRPKYVADAQKRAEKYSKQGVIECPMCVDGTHLDILHILPPLNPDPTDEIIDTDWHVKCPKCNHEDYFTVEFRHDQEEFKEMEETMKQQREQRKKQLRKKRKKR